jgi:hypothetical protein
MKYESTIGTFNPLSSVPPAPQPPVVGQWDWLGTAAVPASDEAGCVYLIWTWRKK